MTYHITQEQALEIAKSVGIVEMTLSDGEVWLAFPQDIKDYANAALDKVLGEPVAWDVYVEEKDNGYLIDSLDDDQWIDDATNHNAVATPLYAPKELP